MKQGLSPGAVAALVALAIVVIGGGGYILMSRTAGAPNGTEQATEEQRAERARAFVDGLKRGAPGGEAAARQGGTSGR